MDVADWLDQAGMEMRRGELLSAVDIAERGLVEHPDSLVLRHCSVLALARAGATDEATRRYRAYEMDGVRDEDVAALGARILKDRALALDGRHSRELATVAAERYASIYARTGGYYPAINAATLSLIAGDERRSRELADEVLTLVAAATPADYFALATRGEALLLLGLVDAARDALAAARTAAGDDQSAMASTRRQLRHICRLQGVDSSVLEVLTGPGVAHFCGHIIAAPNASGARMPAAAERAVSAAIYAAIADRRIGFAYGALAAGADILWAEALIDAGAELNVVLPFAIDEFIAVSVAPAGSNWRERFHACLERAAGVVYASDGSYLGDDALFRYGTELAMGLALVRARHLDAEVVQLAVWDGQPAAGRAGTAIDIATWRKHRIRPSIIVPPPLTSRAIGGSMPEPAANDRETRVIRAMLFADIKGFSKLTDHQMPVFTQHVLGAFADVVTAQGDAVEYVNTWGDALVLVVTDVIAAAACALALHGVMRELDFDALGLPSTLALRLGAHVGPVFPVIDPVLRRHAFTGSHVSQTARIEPVTPPGETYVTDAFAAALALAAPLGLVCDYVGHLPAAKDFGKLRMHRLHPRTRAGSWAT